MLRSMSTILTKIKSKLSIPFTFNNTISRNFGETTVEVSSQGHFMMRVQLYPYTEDEITVVQEGSQITLEARTEPGESVETHTTYTDEWPYYETRRTTITRKYSSSSSIKAYQTLVLPPTVDPTSVKTKFERGDFVVTGYMRPTKVKNSSPLPNVQNVRYFTDEILEVTKKGDILLKVKLHPYKENQVKFRRKDMLVTLEVEQTNVKDTVKEMHPPPSGYDKGQKAFQTRKITSYSYAARSYHLPLDTNIESIKTKFENGYFILTGHLND